MRGTDAFSYRPHHRVRTFQYHTGHNHRGFPQSPRGTPPRAPASFHAQKHVVQAFDPPARFRQDPHAPSWKAEPKETRPGTSLALRRCPPPALCVKVTCGIKTKRQRPQSSSACYEHPSEMSTLAHALHPYAVSFFPEGLKPRNYHLTYRADVCQRNVRFLNTADPMINGQSAKDFAAHRPRSRSNSQTKPPTTILSVIALTHHFRPAEMQDSIATGYDSLRESGVKEVNWPFCHSFRMILSFGRGR